MAEHAGAMPDRFRAFLRSLYLEIAFVTWRAIALLLALHVAASWLLFAVAGEASAGDPLAWLYFYATTATTVGYGDISPQTPVGRLATVLWLYPGAIALFGATLTKAGGGLLSVWNRRINGMGDYSGLSGHSVLVGYHPHRTPRMIDEMLATDPHTQIVLISRKIERNPDTRIAFVRADGLTNAGDLRRAGVAGAARIAIYGDDDEQTLAAALAVSAQAGPQAHLVCYFDSPGSAALLKPLGRPIETVVSTSVEHVVRALLDPGAGQILAMLSSAMTDATVLSLKLPPDAPTMSLASLSDHLHRKVQATLIGFRDDDGRPMLNPSPDLEAGPGDVIYYIRDRRLAETEVPWAALQP